jgi:hypothetical protein
MHTVVERIFDEVGDGDIKFPSKCKHESESRVRRARRCQGPFRTPPIFEYCQYPNAGVRILQKLAFRSFLETSFERWHLNASICPHTNLSIFRTTSSKALFRNPRMLVFVSIQIPVFVY